MSRIGVKCRNRAFGIDGHSATIEYSLKSKRKRNRPGRQANSKPRQSRPPLSVRKKLVFSALLVAFFFGALELLLFVLGVRPVLAEKDPYVGFSSQVPLLVEKRIDGQVVMETAPNKLRWFNAQAFPRHKSPDAYRIFSVGGSTTYGRPYNDAVSFSGWLRELLVEADDSRRWEIINVGGISYASYRIVRVMDELAEYDPDLFIVYTGHNEFLEERTYRDVKRLPFLLRNVGAMLGHTRTYAVLHGLWHRPDAEETDGELPVHHDLEQEVRTRLDGGIGPDAFERDGRLSGKILDHFDFNLRRMIQVARRANAAIVFVTPASNLSDCSPFKSEHEAQFEQQRDWQSRYDAAEKAYRAGQFDTALVDIQKALELAPHHAHSHFLHGRILQGIGRHSKAREAFVRARDEDVCPLRALSSTVDIVRDVAASEQVPLIDFERLIDEQSPHRIPGENWFLDHVHPTIEGNRLLALALFDELVGQQVATRPPNWDAAVDRVVKRVGEQVDQAAHGQALRNLSKVLAWAGKIEESNALALKADRLIGGDAETAYLAGNALLGEGHVNEAISKYKEAIRINPEHAQAYNSLGTAHMSRGDLKSAREYFARVVQLDPSFAAVHNNLGALYQRMNEPELAIQSYQQAIRLNPRYSKAFNNIGVLLRREGKYAEAAEYLQRALAINPDFAEAHFNLGTIHDHQDDKTAAQASYQQAVRLNPRYGPAHHRIGVHFEEQQRWRAALKAYQAALQPPSPQIDAARRAAWIMATCPDSSLRNGNAALRLAQQCAAATKHAEPETLSTLAAAYAETRDFANAVRWQTRAVQLAAPVDKAKHQRRLDTLRARQALRSNAS